MRQRQRLVASIMIGLCLYVNSVFAQDRNDLQIVNFANYEQYETPVIEVDSTLFRIPTNYMLDAYAQATQYYRAQGSYRRRGLYYTTAAHVVEPQKEYLGNIYEPQDHTSIGLYAAQSRYRYGANISYATTIFDSWSFSGSLWGQTGRDLFVEGVFSNSLSPSLRLSKSYDTHHFLTIALDANFSTRGLQYSSTNEAFGLVGSAYYNPSWGLYNGEVRNARVRRQSTPSIEVHYQRPINPTTSLSIDGGSSYSRRANSSIGWYNATTPAPDYYRKMPSYLSEGDAKDFVTNVWRTNDLQYTQINWDEMVRQNSLSSDGNAFYTLEDKVEREIEMQGSVLLHSTLGDRLTLTYGAQLDISTTRKFKEMRDMLGASQFTYYDTYLSDSY